MAHRSNKTLVIVRHAHRVKLDGGAADNGLSPKGRKQAKAIAEWFRREYGKTAIVIVSSPKRRCVETIAPLTRNHKATTALVDELDEGGNVAAKAKRFIKWWRDQAPELTVVSSHGDVLPVLIEQLTGARVKLSKGGVAEIELEDGQILLTSLNQAPH